MLFEVFDKCIRNFDFVGSRKHLNPYFIFFVENKKFKQRITLVFF